jgi:hypothetical protein
MPSLLKQLTLPAIVLVAQATLCAQQIVVPAGTIIQCTLEDSKLSSKTQALDDPILCDTGSLREFGVSVFPRGAYLQGRFADAREPGHLWGKGWMQLQFDHIILPNAELPISAKVVSAPHLKVDVAHANEPREMHGPHGIRGSDHLGIGGLQDLLHCLEVFGRLDRQHDSNVRLDLGND